tara:strand:- start:8474 stop:9364 length:891 start_codon:yes stop_codon:yes gene_type:complete
MKENGLVIARFKNHALIESESKEQYLCEFHNRRLNPIVGDTISWNKNNENTGIIKSIFNRSSYLNRINSKGKPEIIAANLTQLVIVLAETPKPDWLLLDRYLVAAEICYLKAIIVFNKIDLTENLPANFKIYKDLNYDVLAVSAHKNIGTSNIRHHLKKNRSVIIGQSGVGKSSLMNVLMGDSVQKVGELSDKAKLGKHTTTTAILYRLPSGGEIIDFPGARTYSPYMENAQQAEHGFREIKTLRENCRFNNCHHLDEPDCAIKIALVNKKINIERYKSYKQFYEHTKKIKSRVNN